jgi:tripartite-type tricarboxylate transporter receptor subunit TctC
MLHVCDTDVSDTVACRSAGCARRPAPAAAADEYPSRPITLVVPFPPGGSTTVMARIVADKMSELLGQQFVIENRGGAGGTIATKQVAKATPDGYTIALGYTGTLAIGPNLYTNAGYDPRKDFAHIGMIGTAPSILVVHPSVKATTVAELIALAKASDPPLQFGSPGVGTANHMSGELFATVAGIKLTHIPYKGSGPALNDLIGGHIPILFSPIPAAHGNVDDGKLRALMVTAKKRSTLMPDVPSSIEAGLKDFEIALRYGLVAPAGTPRPIVDKLNGALNSALRDEEVKKRIAQEGAEPIETTPEGYLAHVDREETLWTKLIATSNLKVN